MHPFAKSLRRHIFGLSGRDEQLELLQHVGCEVGLAIVPGDDAFGGIRAAQEVQLCRWSVMDAALARYIDEKALAGRRNRARHFGKREPDHLDALVQACSKIFFVGEDARQNANDLVHMGSGGVQEFPVRDRGRIEASGQNPDACWLAGGSRPLNELHALSLSRI